MSAAPRKMWQSPVCDGTDHLLHKKRFPNSIPVLVVDLSAESAESVEAMLEKVCDAMAGTQPTRSTAYSILASLGIKSAKGGRK